MSKNDMWRAELQIPGYVYRQSRP